MRRSSDLGLASDRVEFRDRYISNEEAALLFGAADAAILPYRSASQSGVAQLSFAYGRPVIATSVGGLPAAVRHGQDGLLCEPDDPAALARAIETNGPRPCCSSPPASGHCAEECSFQRYSDLLDAALVGGSSMKVRGLGANSALAFGGDAASKAARCSSSSLRHDSLSVDEFACVRDRACLCERAR